MMVMAMVMTMFRKLTVTMTVCAGNGNDNDGDGGDDDDGDDGGNDDINDDVAVFLAVQALVRQTATAVPQHNGCDCLLQNPNPSCLHANWPYHVWCRQNMRRTSSCSSFAPPRTLLVTATKPVSIRVSAKSWNNETGEDPEAQQIGSDAAT